jgi:CheY-like chemotaxis protein
MSATQPTYAAVRRLVLVADDEPTHRAIVARVIVDLGLVPLLVGDGAAAIAAVEAHQSELVCAILDIAMPGGNGVDAAHVIQLIAPNVALMLMSGAAPANCAGRITRLHLVGVLQKPFPLAALRELLLHTVGEGNVQRMERGDAQPYNSVQDS